MNNDHFSPPAQLEVVLLGLSVSLMVQSMIRHTIPKWFSFLYLLFAEILKQVIWLLLVWMRYIWDSDESINLAFINTEMSSFLSLQNPQQTWIHENLPSIMLKIVNSSGISYVNTWESMGAERLFLQGSPDYSSVCGSEVWCAPCMQRN